MSLPISLAKRRGLIIQEPKKIQPNRNVETDKNINKNKHKQNLNKQKKRPKIHTR